VLAGIRSKSQLIFTVKTKKLSHRLRQERILFNDNDMGTAKLQAYKNNDLRDSAEETFRHKNCRKYHNEYGLLS